MNRALIVFVALMLAIAPLGAQDGKKLTNAQLKEITSGSEGILFTEGYSMSYGTSYHMSWFSEGARKGTRRLYWTNGPQFKVVQGHWRIDGDAVCEKNDGDMSEACNEWRKNADRIETWSHGVQNGYFYVLPKASGQ